MAYQVIQEISIEKLESKINELLKANWKLQGGVSVNYNRGAENNEMFYAQAVVKI
jgi:hypothetical protein